MQAKVVLTPSEAVANSLSIVFGMEASDIVAIINHGASQDVAVMFQVLYDTPTGNATLTVQGYTSDAATYGVRCQIGYRPVGETEQRSEPMSLDQAMETETRGAVLDGEALYVHLLDRDGRDIAVSKIDEVKWPLDATPTTVKAKSYWLNVPPQNLKP